MSWGGILERIQIDAVELLSNPVDSTKLDRKYILALASLLDEDVALQVLQNRKSSGWCSSWLCALTKNFASQHQQIKEQHQQSIIQLEQLMSQQQNEDDGDDGVNKNQQKVQQQRQNQILLLQLKTSYCCSDRCKATLKILLQRSKDFDQGSPEVAQALFKIFPNAEKGLSTFVAATSSADGDLTSSNTNTNQQKATEMMKKVQQSSGGIAKKDNSTAPATSSFQIKEKGVVSSASTNNHHQQQARRPMLIGEEGSSVISLFGNVNNNNSSSINPNRSAAPSLLFSALDPRISVVVLADLLLPSVLKQKWTLQISKLYSQGHPVQKQLLQNWLQGCFGNSNESNSALESFFKRCETFSASQPPNALERLLEMQDQQSFNNTNNSSQNGNTITLSSLSKMSSEEAKVQSNRFRARSMAHDILTSLILEETKRAALLLRFESELPTDFREKIEEFTEVAALPIPIPYEDSKDTWLLFVIMLFVVSGLTDPRFGALFLENVSAMNDIFDSFCIGEGVRGPEILEAFFAV